MTESRPTRATEGFSLERLRGFKLSRTAVVLVLVSTAVGATISYYRAIKAPYNWEITSQLLVQVGRETGQARAEVVGIGGSPAIMSKPRLEDLTNEITLLKSPELLRNTFESLADDIPGFAARPRTGDDAGDEKTKKKKRGGIMSVLSSSMRNLAVDLKLGYQKDRREAIYEAWSKSFRITLLPKSTIIEVNCVASDPDMGVMFLERLLTLYQEEHLHAYSQADTTPQFESEAKRMREVVIEKENQLKEMRLEAGIVDIDTFRQQLVTNKATTEARKRQILADIAAASARVTELDDYLKEVPENSMISESTSQAQIRDHLEQKLADLEMQLVEDHREYLEGTKYLQASKAEIEAMRKLVNEKPEEEVRTRTMGRDPLHTNLRQQLHDQQINIKALKAELLVVEDTLQQFDKDLEHVENIRVVHDLMVDDLDNARADLKQVLEGARIGRINNTLDRLRITNVKVITPPTIPQSPLKRFGMDHRQAIVMGGALIGLFLSLGFFLVRQAIREAGYRHPVDDLAELVADEVIIIPDSPRRPWWKFWGPKNPAGRDPS